MFVVNTDNSGSILIQLAENISKYYHDISNRWIITSLCKCTLICVDQLKSSWWLQMSWHQIGAKPSATTILITVTWIILHIYRCSITTVKQTMFKRGQEVITQGSSWVCAQPIKEGVTYNTSSHWMSTYPEWSLEIQLIFLLLMGLYSYTDSALCKYCYMQLSNFSVALSCFYACY